jgi:hypothetical protein
LWWKTAVIALDKHADGLFCVSQGRREQKKHGKEALGDFHFEQLASSVCQEYASPIAEEEKGSAKKKNQANRCSMIHRCSSSISFVHGAGMVGRVESAGFTTGTLPSKEACGRRKLNRRQTN